MVRIPTEDDFGIGTVETQEQTSAFFSIQPADTGQTGRYLQQAGSALAGIAAEVAERRTETALREEQQLLDEFEMGIINPREGLFSRTGSAASGLSDEVNSTFDQYVADAEDRLRRIGSASGRSAVLNMISGVRSRMYRRAAQYEVQQLEAASRAAASGRRAAAADRAQFNWTDAEETNSALIIAEQAGAADAASRGYQPGTPEYEGRVRYATGEVILGRVRGAQEAGAHVYAQDVLMDAIDRDLVNPELAASMIGDLREAAVDQEAGFHAEAARTFGAGQSMEFYTGTSPQEFVGGIMPAELFDATTRTSVNQEQDPRTGAAPVARQVVVGGGDPDALDPRGEAYRSGSGGGPAREAVEANFRAVQQFDNLIDDRNLMRLGYTRDGLRAMLAYGGPEATLNYIHSAGIYNPTVTPDGQRLGDIYQTYTQAISSQFGTDYQTAEAYFDTIADPEVRDRARQAYQREVEADDWARTRMQDDAFETALSALDDFSRQNPEDIRNARFEDFFSPQDLDTMGRANAEIARTRFDQIRRGIVDPPTDEQAFSTLIDMMETDPERFAREYNPQAYQHNLSQEDRRFFTQQRAAILGEAVEDRAEGGGGPVPMTLNAIRDVIGGVTAALDGDAKGAVERLVSDYEFNYQRTNNGERPSPLQIYEFAQNLVNERFQTTRGFNRSLGPEAFLDLVGGDDLAALIERDDIVLTVQGPGGSVQEIEVTSEQMRRQAAMLQRLTGIQPNPATVLAELSFILGGDAVSGIASPGMPPPGATATPEIPVSP
jgi:hypothetical protein